MNKKFLAKLLIFCMIFTMLPMTAFAGTVSTDGTKYTNDTNGVYAIAFDTADKGEVKAGATATLKANVTYDNAADTTTVLYAAVGNLPTGVTLNADNATLEVANTVAANTTIKVKATATVGVGTDTGVITATKTYTVTAATETPEEITLTLGAETAAVVVGATTDVTVEVTPADTAVTATSDKTDIATVAYADGKVTITGVAAGTATVTVTAGTVSKTITVTVEEPKDIEVADPAVDESGNVVAGITGNTVPETQTTDITVNAVVDNAEGAKAVVTIEGAAANAIADSKVENVVVVTEHATLTLSTEVLAAAAKKAGAEDVVLTVAAAPEAVKAVAAVEVTFTVNGNPVMANAEAGLVVPVKFTVTDTALTQVYAYYYNADGTIDTPVGNGTAVTVENGIATVNAEHFSIVGYEATPQMYTVTYVADNDIDEDVVYKVTADTNFKHTVADNGFTAPTGKKFNGWSTEDGVTTTVGREFTVEKNVTYTAKWTSTSGGGSGSYGGGGGGSASNVSISTKVTGGKVTVSPSRPVRGQTVTLNVKPADGYKLDSITVTDSKGNTIELTKVADNKYTFTMPAGKVTVTPTFVKIDGSDKKDENKTNVDKRFSDVAADAWYAEYINYVAENGLMNGYENGAFGPNDKTTRAQIVTVLYRLEGEPAVQNANSFKDVSAGGQYYSSAVAWAARNNIVNGYEDGRFGPNDNVTREQIATILYRYAAYKQFDTTLAGNISTFSDATKVSSWANTAIAWAVGEGLMNGDNGALRPQGNATRAEIAALLMRFSENIAK